MASLGSTPWADADLNEDWGTPSTRDPWDQVILGGAPLPGVCSVSGMRSRKLDVRSGPGVNRATITDLGVEAARFDLVILLWTDSHLQTWQSMQDDLIAWKKALTPLPVLHPALALAGVSDCVIERVSMLVPSSEPGVMTTTLSCVEWAPAPKAQPPTTPKESKGKGAGWKDVPVVTAPSRNGTAGEP